jgi:hypothetical protein
MDELLARLIATFVTVPLFAFFFVYFCARKVWKRKRKSFYAAVNVSTLFFIVAVHYLLIILSGKSYLLYIILFLLVMHMLIAIGYWRKKADFHLVPVFRLFWRASFLLFSSLYVGLLVYGMVTRVLANL